MTLADAIAVFDKSADRTRPNAQTEAWAVIRAELMRVMDAPVGFVIAQAGPDWVSPHKAAVVQMDNPEQVKGQRVRLVAVGGREEGA